MNLRCVVSVSRRLLFIFCLSAFTFLSCSLAVLDEPSYYTAKGVPTTASISKSSLRLDLNASPVQLTASVAPAITGSSGISWTTSDATVATVDATGLVTPVSLGTATITAHSDSISSDYAKASCKVTIKTSVSACIKSAVPASFDSPYGVAVDVSGNLYVADTDNNKIRKITSSGMVTTIAGSGSSGSTDGIGTNARFDSPCGVAVDNSGNVYVADTGNNKIRKIDSSGVVTTFAGSGTSGSTDGTGTSSSFSGPEGVAVDSFGNVYVGDTYNNIIRKINSIGVVKTLAGSGYGGWTDASGTSARFSHPCGVAVDSIGNVYVADTENNKIRKIDSSGMVSTLAGSGTVGSIDGNGESAYFYYPCGVAVDSMRNVYVADTYAHRIRKIDTSRNVTTFAGSASFGSIDAMGPSASFNHPYGVTVDSSGTLYVADSDNQKIRKIDLSRTVTTFAGTGSSGSTDGQASSVSFSSLAGCVRDSSGNIYTIDGCAIRKIASDFSVTIFAGSVSTSGSSDGSGISARFYDPSGLAIDSAGTLFVVDDSKKIRKITSSGSVTTLADLSASNSSLRGVAVDVSGNIYVADFYKDVILKITSAGTITTFAGSTDKPGFIDGGRTSARFFYPNGVAVDSSGNVYVAEEYNDAIRKIDSSGTVTTLAGSGSSGSTDGTGKSAEFNNPQGIAIDSSGNLYVVDTGNDSIRKITADGTVTTVASISASSTTLRDIFVTSGGTVYVTDSGNKAIYTFETRRGQ